MSRSGRIRWPSRLIRPTSGIWDFSPEFSLQSIFRRALTTPEKILGQPPWVLSFPFPVGPLDRHRLEGLDERHDVFHLLQRDRELPGIARLIGPSGDAGDAQERRMRTPVVESLKPFQVIRHFCDHLERRRRTDAPHGIVAADHMAPGTVFFGDGAAFFGNASGLCLAGGRSRKRQPREHREKDSARFHNPFSKIVPAGPSDPARARVKRVRHRPRRERKL